MKKKEKDRKEHTRCQVDGGEKQGRRWPEVDRLAHVNPMDGCPQSPHTSVFISITGIFDLPATAIDKGIRDCS